MLFVASSLIGGALNAAPTTYSDLTSFQSSTYGVTTDDFNSLPSNSELINGYSNDGVTYSASNGYLFTWGPATGQDLGTGTYLLGPSWPNSLTATLSSPQSAVGLDLTLDYSAAPASYAPDTMDVTAEFLSGQSANYSVSFAGNADFQFFGITNLTDPITSVTLTPPNLYPQYYCDPNVCYNGLGAPNAFVDNFMTGSASPEPCTLAIFGLGITALGVRSISAKRKASRS